MKRIFISNKSNLGMKAMIILPLIFLMAILPIVSSAVDYLGTESIGTFKQGECMNIIQTCSTCTYVNLSRVLYPNSGPALGEVKMTKTGTYYNYTFCNTGYLGVYSVNGHGDLDGREEVFAYTFSITPAGGAENNTTIFIILSVIAIVLLLLSFIFHNYIFSVIAGFAFLGTGVYGMIYGFGDITNLYTRIIAYIIIALGGIITIVSALDLLKESSEGGDSYSYSEEE